MPGVHLTLEERKSIQFGLDSCKSKVEIAVGISKSGSTVSKEIKRYKIAKVDAYAMRSFVNVCLYGFCFRSVRRKIRQKGL